MWELTKFLKIKKGGISMEGANTLQSLLSGLDFTSLTENYLLVAGIMIPVAIGIKVVKKGISWTMGFFHKM